MTSVELNDELWAWAEEVTDKVMISLREKEMPVIFSYAEIVIYERILPIVARKKSLISQLPFPETVDQLEDLEQKLRKWRDFAETIDEKIETGKMDRTGFCDELGKHESGGCRFCGKLSYW